jgi:plasmid replication initiation protein
MEKELLRKPNQTIMITNDGISALQRKAYNVILHKAWHELKTNKNKTDFKFSISEIKSKSGLAATDNVKLKKSLHDLSKRSVEVIKDNGDWSIFNLISSTQKEGDFLVIELPKPVREALIANDYYTALDLLQLKKLSGKYAIIFYEMAIRYCKKQIPEFTIEELRDFTGTTDTKSYDNFNLFNKKVLIPAINEINQQTDIILTYETRKKGKKVIAVKFFVKPKDNHLLESAETTKLNETEILSKIFFEETGAEFPINELEELIALKGYDLIKEYFINAKKFNYNVNPVGFFIKAIKEEWKIPLRKRKSRKTVPQETNYEQRNYSKEYLESLYENTK